MSEWEAICREREMAYARQAQIRTSATNGKAAKGWKRPLWWARFSVYVWVVVASSAGVLLNLLCPNN